MRLVINIVLLFVASNSVADPQPWMKQENPDELAVYAWAMDDCPFTTDELRADVEGVITRSRIKVESKTTLYLNVIVICEKDLNTESLHIYSVKVDFGSLMSGHLMLFDSGFYGGLGAGTKGTILSNAKGAVEDAITDYLKANFDL